MKSLSQLSTTIALLGSTLLGSFFIQDLAAWALPEKQILEKLSPVPVFTIADGQGAPLVASGKDNGNKVAGVFISQKDAASFVTKLQKQNPELGKQVKVVPVSLGEIYKLAEDNKKQKDGLNFAYVPVQGQVESAKTILTQNKQKYEGGVPLFVAKGGKDNGYLTIEQNSQQIIPFFFEKEQLQQMVEKFKKQKPDLASSVKIEVVPLEGVIDALKTSNDEMLKKILLVPSQESLKFIQSLGGNQNGGKKPAQNTPKKK